jgi:hypothetical protein
MKHKYFLHTSIFIALFFWLAQAMESSKDTGKTPPNTPIILHNKESRRLLKGSTVIAIQVGYRLREAQTPLRDPLENTNALNNAIRQLPEIVAEEQMQEKK